MLDFLVQLEGCTASSDETKQLSLQELSRLSKNSASDLSLEFKFLVSWVQTLNSYNSFVPLFWHEPHSL